MPCVDVEPAAVRLLKPASTPIKEHLPSFPRRLKLQLVVIPTNAVFPDDIFFIASIHCLISILYLIVYYLTFQNSSNYAVNYENENIYRYDCRTYWS